MREQVARAIHDDEYGKGDMDRMLASGELKIHYLPAYKTADAAIAAVLDALIAETAEWTNDRHAAVLAMGETFPNISLAMQAYKEGMQ